MGSSCKYFIGLLVFIQFIATAGAQDKSLVDMSDSPYAVLQGINMDDVQWTEGFWTERFSICKDSMVPSMWKILDSPEISHAFRNFEIAAGEGEGCHSGPPFHDGDFYKWFESLVAVYIQTGDPELEILMDEIISMIARSQRSDPTRPQLRPRVRSGNRLSAC